MTVTRGFFSLFVSSQKAAPQKNAIFQRFLAKLISSVSAIAQKTSRNRHFHAEIVILFVNAMESY